MLAPAIEGGRYREVVIGHALDILLQCSGSGLEERDFGSGAWVIDCVGDRILWLLSAYNFQLSVCGLDEVENVELGSSHRVGMSDRVVQLVDTSLYHSLYRVHRICTELVVSKNCTNVSAQREMCSNSR